MIISDVLAKEKNNIGKTQPQQPCSLTIPLMIIQEHSGDSGQYQGSFPGDLGIVAANFQGEIR